MVDKTSELKNSRTNINRECNFTQRRNEERNVVVVFHTFLLGVECDIRSKKMGCFLRHGIYTQKQMHEEQTNTGACFRVQHIINMQ